MALPYLKKRYGVSNLPRYPLFNRVRKLYETLKKLNQSRLPHLWIVGILKSIRVSGIHQIVGVGTKIKMVALGLYGQIQYGNITKQHQISTQKNIFYIIYE